MNEQIGFVPPNEAEAKSTTKEIVADSEFRLMSDWEKSDARIWARSIGKRAEITFTSMEQGEPRTIKGRIVNFKSGGDLGTVGTELHLVNEQDGRYVVVMGSDMERLRIVEDDLGWKWNKVSQMVSYRRELEIEAAIAENKGLVVAIAGRARGEDKSFVISGKIKREELYPSYFVYEVTDDAGRKHLVDFNYLSEDTMVAYIESDKLATSGSIATTELEPVRLVDENFAKRKELIENLFQTKNPFETPEFYEYYEANLSEAEQLVERLYGQEGETLVTRVKGVLEPKHIALLVDPGIANRLDELISFVETNPEVKIEPSWALRSKFSEHLGNRVVYRGMMLTDHELASIKEQGILASALLDEDKTRRSLTHTLQPQAPYIPKPFPTSPREEITARLALFGGPFPVLSFLYNSNLMSVSTHREVAESIGYHNSYRGEDPDARMYVFQLSVPEISLLWQKNLFDEYQRNTPPNEFLRIGDLKINRLEDLGVEMFIPYRIASNQIEKVIPIESKPVKYEIEYRDMPVSANEINTKVNE